MRLLNRVNPEVFESIYSFLFRNSTVNYYKHLASIISEQSSRIYKTNCNYVGQKCTWFPYFKSITDSLGVDINKFVLNQFDNVIFGEYMTDKLIDNRVYEKEKTKYCPSCLQENFYHRLYWDISFVTACESHNCYLIDRCTNCSKKITMSNLMQNSCSCGQIFTCMTAGVPSEIIMETQRVIQRTLLDNTQQSVILSDGRILEKSGYFFLFLAFCSIIDNLPGEIFFKQAGIYKPVINFNSAKKEERDIQMMSLVSVVSHQLISVPFQHLTNLLKNIEEINVKMNKETGKSRNRNLRRYRVLKTIIDSKDGSIYHDCYSQCVNNFSFDSFNKRLIKSNVAQKKYLSTTEVIKIMRKDFNVINHLCDIGILTSHRTNTNSLLIESASVERYYFIKNNSYSMGQLCKLLGIQFVRAVELFDYGLITAYWGPKTNGYKIWHFNKVEAHALLDRIINQSSSVDMPPASHMPLKAVLSLVVPLGHTFAEIVKKNYRWINFYCLFEKCP
ncbi:TniQ family protein [Cohnella ginsengisoli]|uniref:TniQ family protein n=1 Tax=Cohnella ginsengisoli TaxID=425004 RepID=A0A9X4QL96_9BACL|nr:TniQ family protein [Cohnella ginsengisoli]MDG0789936.1 TniQ family protein [Cohnella ginsengisoli]